MWPLWRIIQDCLALALTGFPKRYFNPHYQILGQQCINNTYSDHSTVKTTVMLCIVSALHKQCDTTVVIYPNLIYQQRDPVSADLHLQRSPGNLFSFHLFTRCPHYPILCLSPFQLFLLFQFTVIVSQIMNPIRMQIEVDPLFTVNQQ